MLQMYGNGYSMAIVLDHRSTATSLTGNFPHVKCAVCHYLASESRDSIL